MEETRWTERGNAVDPQRLIDQHSSQQYKTRLPSLAQLAMVHQLRQKIIQSVKLIRESPFPKRWSSPVFPFSTCGGGRCRFHGVQFSAVTTFTVTVVLSNKCNPTITQRYLGTYVKPERRRVMAWVPLKNWH